MLTAIFDGSLDGFLSVVYSCYYDKRPYDYVYEDGVYQQQLDSDYFYVPTEPARSVRVMEAIGKRVSQDAQTNVCYCCLANDKERFTSLLRYVRLGFKAGAAADNYLQDPHVLKVHKLVQYVLREAHLLTGFCRFKETKSGVYYASISPVNNALPILAEHFRERLMNQPWVIHDTARGIAAVYDCNDYRIDPVKNSPHVDCSDDEARFQELWRAFFDSVAIKERLNKDLQRNLIPLRFRKHVTEFQNNSPAFITQAPRL
ncbi:MAG: TIGR03915 family putative DNA repair protein [Clostridiales bacterium]|jgi:probable DNA metabolism protein|nr:TIGR03915 family putative DNA repair protein [Clostridiales bacterium]